MWKSWVRIMANYQRALAVERLHAPRVQLGRQCPTPFAAPRCSPEENHWRVPSRKHQPLRAFTTERPETATNNGKKTQQEDVLTAQKIALDGIRRERHRDGKGTGLEPQQLVHADDVNEEHIHPTWDEDRCPAFHLPTAVALGHCSFEAYNAPSNIHGLKEVDLHGTETVYMDREFMEEVITGVLALHVHSAALMPLQDVDGRGKPSVSMRLGPSAGSTAEADGFQGQAEWGETLYLYVRDLEKQRLEIIVTDKQTNGEKSSEDAVVGSATLRGLSAVCDGRVHELDVHLDGADETSPLIHISLQYLDHGEDFDAITELPKLAFLQMQDDDGWGHVEEPREWFDSFDDESPVSMDEQQGNGASTEESKSSQNGGNPGESKSSLAAEGHGASSAAVAEERRSTDDGHDGSMTFESQDRGSPSSENGDAGSAASWDGDERSEIQESPMQGSEHGLLDVVAEGLQTIDAADLAVALSSGDQIATGEAPDREDFQVWRDLYDEVARRDLASQMTPIVFLVNRAVDTEVWVYRNKEKREAVFAFRGTSSPQDMLTDTAFTLSAFCPGDRPPSRSPEEVAAEIADEDVTEGPMKSIFSAIDSLERLPGMDTLTTPATSWVKGLRGWAKGQLYSYEHKEKWVHKGFLEAYSSVRSRIVSLAHEVMSDGSDEPWTIFVTGHSLGGALAVLCAYELKATRWEEVPSPEVVVYTFGQPRVGNVAFSEDYDALVPHTWRVKNVNDIVTRVPAVLGYAHVGCAATVCPDGGIMLSTGSGDDLQDSVAVEDILGRITSGMDMDMEKAKSKLGGVVEKEMGLWRSLLTGAAILEHMESKYHQVLETCIEAGGKKCEPVIKSIDGIPTREHVERLLRKASSSKELLPSPQRVEGETPSFADDTVEVLSRSLSKKGMKKKEAAQAA